MEKTQTNLKQHIIARNSDLAEFLVYSAIAFLVPFSLGHPQFLVGTLVNMSLILAALNLKNSKLLPIALLPSMAVIARGIIFGSFTVFLAYMVPFIWIGNFLLVFLSQRMKWVGVGIGIVLKAAFLYSIAILLIKAGVLPKVFAISMGTIQLYTALAGGILALAIQKIRSKSN